jgi:multiple sugar transport system permease protein
VFFVIPYIRVLYYSLIDNQFRRGFVGLANYARILGNEYFRLAFWNSMLLIFIAVPVLIALALFISISFYYGLKKWRMLKSAFVLPLVIPTASVVLGWQLFFSGLDNVLPIYLLFIWKNIGICIILLTAALTRIDGAVREAAGIDGAFGFRMHRSITMPIIMPTIVFCGLLSVVNSFRIYREVFLYYGGTNFPPGHSYTLQYYMNNHFLRLDYQALASSSVLTSLLVFGIVAFGFYVQGRYRQ